MVELPSYYDPEADISITERKRREVCTSKTTYATAELARASALQAEWGGGNKAAGLIEYRCKFCQRWHLSARLG